MRVLQLKDTALPPSPVPLSVVPLELTAWMVNRLFLLFRRALLFAGCSLAGRLGEHASSCLSSSFSSSVVLQCCCGRSAGGCAPVSVVPPVSLRGLSVLLEVSALVLQRDSVWFWDPFSVSGSPWSSVRCAWLRLGWGSATALPPDWLSADVSPQQGSV